MEINTSKIVPTAFWIGLLALGFVTNAAGPEKDRAALRRAVTSAKTTVVERDHAFPPAATPPSR
jgi:hypothetical protein